MGETQEANASYGFGYRHVLAFLTMCMSMAGAFFQAGINVGVVSMTSKNSSNPDFEEFEWDSVGKNAILSSVFWGILVGSLPAGQLCQLMNVKHLTLAGIGLASVTYSLIPFLAERGWPYVSAACAVVGFTMGVIRPCSYAIISKWAPPKEAGLMLSIVNMGQVIGIVTGLPLMGLLAKWKFGWPSIFYVATLFGLLWCVIFFIFGSSSPANHNFISEKEKEYIIVNQEGAVTKQNCIPTPWGKILTSPAVIFLTLGELCNGFGASVITTEIPSYIDDVLNLPIELNGVVSALPTVGVLLFLTPSAWLADTLVQRGTISLSFSKKFYTFIGMGINGSLLILVGLCGKNSYLAITLICLATACATLMIPGLHTVHLCIAPNFAGVLMGITTTGATISAVIAPLTVSLIVKNKTAEEWMWVFVETGAVLITGCVIFCLYGSTELQSWNSIEEDESDKKNDHKITSIA